ncbi:hypothetical protein JCM31598_29290 [Desulfonatronum parangueonense]
MNTGAKIATITQNMTIVSPIMAEGEDRNSSKVRPAAENRDAPTGAEIGSETRTEDCSSRGCLDMDS